MEQGKVVTDPAAFPWLISIVDLTKPFSTAEAHLCSGSLVAPNIVLTSAHCIKRRQNKVYPAVLQRNPQGGGLQVTTVAEIWSGREVSGERLPTDTALLRLAADLPGPYVQMAYLKPEAEVPFDLEMVSWGHHGAGGQPELTSAELVSRDHCQSQLEATGRMGNVSVEENVCAIVNPISCGADTGAPLLVLGASGKLEDINVIGVRSFVASSCASSPVVYGFATFQSQVENMKAFRDSDIPLLVSDFVPIGK